ncbi:DUF2493 domain-containing protein [Erythrobacter sp. SCSIO 43205]|uniref:DUF2493 domain-containing protein n=1 Tax=Erythrobacter sp. SCSIO 43205 TaxID=2779361 RepID=UPI001CA8F77D|nr:DUF2493 domain-containing protein [Erythrobacter sp. SCSIO 43205]UAB79001.1 DUF2493 domain-containing protein [Erythrobacter sp. SCSIO 43205]
MYDNLASQLAGLDPSGFSIAPAPFNDTDFPAETALQQVLEAVWSDLFALFADTALEADAEDLAWGFVNLFHRAASRKSSQLDRATDEIRALITCADGSEVHSSKLEEQVLRAQSADASMQAFEQMREIAACLYRDETGSSWKPVAGSRAMHSRTLTSAVIDGRDFLRARRERRMSAHSPEGTPVVFAGGRNRFASDTEAKTYAANIWATLDKVRNVVPDLYLVHGGDTKGADRLAASWAERHEVQQLTFSLDRRLGARAGFKRNEQMLALQPRYVVAFPGNGVTERLVVEARRQRITIVDRRGPLGTCLRRQSE